MTPATILDHLMQGTARRPLTPAGPLAQGISPEAPTATLRLLALAAQAQRFTLPAAPAQFDTVSLPPDARAIVPEPARRLMLRLVAGKGSAQDDPAAFALVFALDQLQLRPHPFDVPHMAAFVRKHAELLGPSTCAVLAAPQQGDETGFDSGGLGAAALDASNWMLATPALKAAFIAHLRQSAPETARALVEQQLPVEKADVRVRLIEALTTGLTTADQALLESLQADRAPSVKQASTRLLARLPGSQAAQAQLEALRSRMVVKTKGLLRKRTDLSLDLPATVHPGAATAHWVAANFCSVGTHALAAAFALDETQLVAAAEDDTPLQLGIACSAASERHFRLLRQYAESPLGPELLELFFQVGLVPFGLVTPQDRADWADAVVAPLARRLPDLGPQAVWNLPELYRCMEGPLPAATARLWFSATLRAEHGSDVTLTLATALMPLEAMHEAREALSRLPADAAPRATLLADTLLSLIQDPPTHERHPTAP